MRFQGRLFITGATAAIFVGCVSGHCRTQHESNATLAEKRTQDGEQLKETFKTPQTASGERSSPSATAGTTVRVFKSDGTLQCGKGKKIPIERIASELKGINILEKYAGDDGMMHSSNCGGVTGTGYIFVIPSADLKKAQDLKLKELSESR